MRSMQRAILYQSDISLVLLLPSLNITDNLSLSCLVHFTAFLFLCALINELTSIFNFPKITRGK